MMIIPVDLPWTNQLWKEIESGITDRNLPVYSWGITDDQFVQLERFLNVVVANGLNVYWDHSHISTIYAKLFMAWIAEHYRRNGSVTQNIATDYKVICGFTQPREWNIWIDRGESALGRSAIFVGGDVRSYVARIQQESGLVRKVFEGYESGGCRSDKSTCIYWTTILELWDRLDYSEHQLLQWKTGKDWYSREPGGRPGGEGFYSQFYESSLIFLRQISQTLAQKPSLLNDPQRLSEELAQWVEPSLGLINFLKDICGESATLRKRSAASSWEPKAERCLYLGGGTGNVCTRLRPPVHLPVSMLPGLQNLGGDRLFLKAFGEVTEYDLGQYFTTSGSAYQAVAEQYLAPLDAVRVCLQGKDEAIESMLLDPLQEEQPWLFVLESSEGTECWKLVDDAQGKFPIIVSLPQASQAAASLGVVSFELIQPGLQNRVCLRFESLEQFQASGLELVRGAGRSLLLAPLPAKQPMQLVWDGRPVPVSMGVPRVATGARGVVERSDTAKGVYLPVQAGQTQFECGYYRVRSGNEVGPAMRLAVLPPSFAYTSEEPSPSSIKVLFSGLPDGNAPQPLGVVEEGLWKAVQYGSFLEYSLGNGLEFRIPAPVSGMAWKRMFGQSIPKGHVSLNMEQDTSLCLDVVRNPATVTLEVSLIVVKEETVKIPLEHDFFAVIGAGNRTQGRINLGALGDGIVRKLFAMTNHQDAMVKITGMLKGGGLREERLPELTIHRFDRDKDATEELNRFWVYPLDPMEIGDSEPTEQAKGLWFSVPCALAAGKKVWNRTHRPSGAVIGAEQTEWPEGTLQHILLHAKPWDFTNKILDRLDQDFNEDEWTLIEDSFRLMREHEVPLVSLWLPQVVLRHDKTLCTLFEKQIHNHLHKWILQSSQGRFGTFGFDLRLVRTSLLNQLGRACREALWSELHLIHTGERLEDVDVVRLMNRKWFANPETGHNSNALQLRWSRLYESGDSTALDLDDKAYSKWEESNAPQLKTWDSQRCNRLNQLVFKDGLTEFEFDSEQFGHWEGYISAWDRNPKLQIPKWIKATKWLGWFTVHATDEQYRLYLPFALKAMKMLEATDPEWFKSAIQIAQAQAILN